MKRENCLHFIDAVAIVLSSQNEILSKYLKHHSIGWRYESQDTVLIYIRQLTTNMMKKASRVLSKYSFVFGATIIQSLSAELKLWYSMCVKIQFWWANELNFVHCENVMLYVEQNGSTIGL